MRFDFFNKIVPQVCSTHQIISWSGHWYLNSLVHFLYSWEEDENDWSQKIRDIDQQNIAMTLWKLWGKFLTYFTIIFHHNTTWPLNILQFLHMIGEGHIWNIVLHMSISQRLLWYTNYSKQTNHSNNNYPDGWKEVRYNISKTSVIGLCHTINFQNVNLKHWL